MTDEQIKQNAEEYILPLKTLPGADENITFIAAIREAYIAGAHSRDEEIKRLENRLALFNDDLDKALYRKEKFRHKNQRAQQHIKYLQAELNKLHNPWISIKDRLPEEGDEIILKRDYVVSYFRKVRAEDIRFIEYSEPNAKWMLIPKIQKGE